jgi:hypothetical protein
MLEWCRGRSRTARPFGQRTLSPVIAVLSNLTKPYDPVFMRLAVSRYRFGWLSINPSRHHSNWMQKLWLLVPRQSALPFAVVVEFVVDILGRLRFLWLVEAKRWPLRSFHRLVVQLREVALDPKYARNRPLCLRRLQIGPQIPCASPMTPNLNTFYAPAVIPHNPDLSELWFFEQRLSLNVCDVGCDQNNP